MPRGYAADHSIVIFGIRDGEILVSATVKFWSCEVLVYHFVFCRCETILIPLLFKRCYADYR